MKNRSGVWIFSHEGFWFVGVGRGYYNRPLSKAEAIKRARELARARGESSRPAPPISVFDEGGELIEQVA